MSFTFYRADSRTPDDIRAAGGFKAWVPLRLDQAQALIRKARNENVEDSFFPESLQESFGKVFIRKPVDLQTWIKYTKNKTTTPQVSMAYDEDCGGQAVKDEKGRSSKIYEIELDGLSILQSNDEVVPAVQNDFPHTGPFPKVVISGRSLAEATLVGIVMKDELALLTGVPLANIKRVGHRNAGDITWTDF